MDFVHDQLATGRELPRADNRRDTFSRFSPALEPHFTFRGADVLEVLEKFGRQVGFPATIRVDQGTEFVSRDLDLWAYRARRDIGLLQTRQAQRQRLHRSIQQPLPSGMSECCGRNLAVYPDAGIRLAISRAVGIEGSRGWKISKDKQAHKIDVVVALGMAALAAVKAQGQSTYRCELVVGERPDDRNRGRTQRGVAPATVCGLRRQRRNDQTVSWPIWPCSIS